MTSAAKAKGDAWERECCTYLRAAGVFAERIPAGSSADRGDLFIPGWCVQAKNQRRIDLGPWMTETLTQQSCRDAPWHALLVKRRGFPSAGNAFAVMTGEQLAALMLLTEAS